MSQAFDKLFRPLQEVRQELCSLGYSTPKSVLADWVCASLTQALAHIRLPDLQGATNQQLEHAMMVLLQTLEDLIRAQYKGATVLLWF